MKSSEQPEAFSARRRSCVGAALAAPWLGAVTACGGGADEDPSGAPGEVAAARLASDATLVAAAAAPEPLSNAAASTEPSTPPLGNPQVPANRLRNYVFGPVALQSVTGAANVGVGESVLRSLTTGFNNTAVGDQALRQQQSGINCVAVGALALYNATNCVDCTAAGVGALQAARNGVGATAVGRLSCNEMLEANNNSGFGDSTLRRTTTGLANTAMGYRAAESNTTGSGNVVLGAQAAVNMPLGDRNVVVGFHTLQSSDPGVEENVAVGSHAGVVGPRNVAVGVRAGRRVRAGEGNVFVGPDAGSADQQKVDASNSIAIGYQSYTTRDNQVVIGNPRTETIVLAGVEISKSQLLRLLQLVGPP